MGRTFIKEQGIPMYAREPLQIFEDFKTGEVAEISPLKNSGGVESISPKVVAVSCCIGVLLYIALVFMIKRAADT